MGQVPFSPELKRLSLRIGLWEGVVKKKKSVKFSMSKFRRLEQATGITNALHHSQEEAEANLAAVKVEYVEFKKTAKKKRKAFLEDLAQAIAESTDKKQASVYRQLIHREAQRESGRKVRAALGKGIKGGIKRVEIVNENGEVEEIITKHGIERVCLDENEAKYRQTQQTPCMTNPLRRVLGLFGDTEFCDKVLDGTFQVIPQMSNYTIELFRELKRPEDIPPLSLNISPEDFQSSWKKMKEYTSSASSSGLHFGHMKACSGDKLLTTFESSIAHVMSLATHLNNGKKVSLL